MKVVGFLIIFGLVVVAAFFVAGEVASVGVCTITAAFVLAYLAFSKVE